MLIVSAATAEDDRYVIRNLIPEGVQQPTEPPPYIAPLEGNLLSPPAAPVQEAGYMYLRRKFLRKTPGGLTHILYKGRVPRSCYRGLSFFRIEGTTFEQRIKLKYYRDRNFASHADEEDVLFDGDYVLVPGASTLYYWKDTLQLEAMRAEEMMGCAEIRSEPSEAELVFDGTRLGKSPRFISGLRPDIFSIRLTLPGHDTAYAYVSIEPCSTTTLHLELFKLPAAALTSRLRRPDTLPGQDCRTAEACQAAESSLRKRIDTLRAAREALLRTYRAVQPKEMQSKYESREDWKTRSGATSDRRDAKEARMTGRYDSLVSWFGAHADSLGRKARRLRCQCQPLQFSGQRLTVSKYDTGWKTSHFRFEVDQDAFHFYYEGLFRFSSINEAEKFLHKKDGATLRAVYRRIPYRVPKGLELKEGRLLYLTMDSLQVKLGNKTIPQEGRFGYLDTLGMAVRAARDSIDSCGADDSIVSQPKSRLKWWTIGGAGAAGVAGIAAFLILKEPEEQPKADEFEVNIQFEEEP